MILRYVVLVPCRYVSRVSLMFIVGIVVPSNTHDDATKGTQQYSGI